MIILGAGLSGLIAATQFPAAKVIERGDQNSLSHRAVLRFRSDGLSRLTGIPFRKVTVRKSIWHEGEHRAPNIQLANFYSRKTNHQILDRSIWNLDPAERYIAPEDLTTQMAAAIGNRISWGREVDAALLASLPRPIISTIPMTALLSILPGNGDTPEFNYSGIQVDRYRITGADVFQTIYFPTPTWAVYRASITGDLLIVERSGALREDSLRDVLEAFGLNSCDVTPIDSSHSQKYGKITPIDDDWRRQFIYETTLSHGIYAMGRFAIWRNVLLDDVINDGAVIKHLITRGNYQASLQHNRKPSQ